MGEGIDNSNTGLNRRAGQFVKGDKRINRKGRPRSFDALRALAQEIAKEDLVNAEGDRITRVELILRDWAQSRNPILQKQFMEVAYGKVPDEIVNNGKVTLRIVRDEIASADIAPEADGVRE